MKRFLTILLTVLLFCSSLLTVRIVMAEEDNADSSEQTQGTVIEEIEKKSIQIDNNENVLPDETEQEENLFENETAKEETSREEYEHFLMEENLINGGEDNVC